MQDYRADIDGLRALAVSSVVLFHAAPLMVPAGFVGVDIFFVISGYLIGGIIYTGVLDKSFSFGSFYARRSRRILPALIAVVLASLVAGYFLLDALAYKKLGSQSLAALIGVSNIYFWRTQSYFAPDAEHEPMTMTWSLGVEEQFYVCFPFIMIAILRLPLKWRLVSMAGLVAASFALSIYTLRISPTSAFYLLPQRAWELAIGVLLAILHAEKLIPVLRREISESLSLVGLGLILASFFLFDAETPFPGWMVLMPVVGTALLIQTRESLINRFALSFRPIVFIGLVSYSWYLWHWPLMAYIRVVSDEGQVGGALLQAIPVSFILAVLSWRFIEQPFRNRTLPTVSILMRYAAALLVMLSLPTLVHMKEGIPDRLPEQVVVANQIAEQGLSRRDCLAMFTDSHPNEDEACQPEGSRIAVLGDSHAAAASVSLSLHAKAQGTVLTHYTKAACTPLLGMAREDPERPEHAYRCGAFMESAMEMILTDAEIDTVYIIAAWPANANDPWHYRQFSDGKLGKAVNNMHAMQVGLSGAVDHLEAGGKQVILVKDVPHFEFDPMKRVISNAMPLRKALRDGLGAGLDMEETHAGIEHRKKEYDQSREIVEEIAETRPDVGIVDMQEHLCDGQECQYSKDGMPLYVDPHHLSDVGADHIDWEAIN